MALGSHYCGTNANEEDKDIEKAIKWYEKGAEFGYPQCMLLVAILYSMKGHAIRKIVGGHPGIDNSVKALQRGLYWANKAKSMGIDEADQQIVSLTGEIGILRYS